MSRIVVLVARPTSTILPAPSTAMFSAKSSPPRRSVVTVPWLAKVVSMVPSAPYRMSRKSRLATFGVPSLTLISWVAVWTISLIRRP
jgi:hypothetical protein